MAWWYNSDAYNFYYGAGGDCYSDGGTVWCATTRPPAGDAHGAYSDGGTSWFPTTRPPRGTGRWCVSQRYISRLLNSSMFT